jgi:hypothetical protein
MRSQRGWLVSFSHFGRKKMRDNARITVGVLCAGLSDFLF